MQTFYIFSKQTGDFIGTRGIAPDTDNEIGIEATPEAVEFMTTAVVPMLVGGQLKEMATPEQIAEAQNPMTTPISRMRFWLNVWRILRLTEKQIVSMIEQMEESDKRQELLIMVETATEFERYNESLLYMANEMNISDEVLNQIFT
jgi:hypothetical protein